MSLLVQLSHLRPSSLDGIPASFRFRCSSAMAEVVVRRNETEQRRGKGCVPISEGSDQRKRATRG